MWFGNLVTLDWWSDTWLNEGFATWFEHYALDHIKPQWRRMELFFAETIPSVLNTEDKLATPGGAAGSAILSLASGSATTADKEAKARRRVTADRRVPLYNPEVLTTDEAIASFSGHTNPYRRGAAVLSMFFALLGEEDFIRAIRVSSLFCREIRAFRGHTFTSYVQ